MSLPFKIFYFVFVIFNEFCREILNLCKFDGLFRQLTSRFLPKILKAKN
ncbi:hypothetical protein DCCM_4791 [Desulfocucumis palustris]|uniref:Uncharacterized protein n=1 Tax=Desulfocucumis palustris TaxID=1898651 RepID=A0A2L2XHQ9_9FIRM|nr:hypothetical protein DCCM_4791 [Desulfocucumis palustris]